jgi:hypothetical protein
MQLCLPTLPTPGAVVADHLTYLISEASFQDLGMTAAERIQDEPLPTSKDKIGKDFIKATLDQTQQHTAMDQSTWAKLYLVHLQVTFLVDTGPLLPQRQVPVGMVQKFAQEIEHF